MAAKTATDLAIAFSQEALSQVPVILLGSGASLSHGVPGMWQLSEHLSAAVQSAEWQREEVQEWELFLGQLNAGMDLESVLKARRLTDRQTAYIVKATRDLILPADRKVFSDLLSNRRSLPLSRLYKHFFDSTHRMVNVITPNYDRIAEYAADAIDVSVFTGFGYGYLRHRARDPRMRVHIDGREARTVAVWKVHGSLDWFQDPLKQIIGMPDGAVLPEGFTPLMITPGIEKYRLTHEEPFRTIISCSDHAIENARAYLCIGYGFNDEHIQAKLIERCDRDAVPLIVVTKEISTSARSLLESGRCRKYLAIEESGGGARAYTPEIPHGFEVDRPLWRLADFLDATIGEGR